MLPVCPRRCRTRPRRWQGKRQRGIERIVGVLVTEAIIVAAPMKQAFDSTYYLRADGVDLLVARPEYRHEAHAVVRLQLEYTVGDDGVKVYVDVPPLRIPIR